MSIAVQPSRLDSQLELLGDDIDIATLPVWINAVRTSTDLASRITSGTVSRTIEGASTLTLTVADYDRSVLRALRTGPIDVNVDGLWFRLYSIDKQLDILTLTFEDREVALLRTYPRKTAPFNGFRAVVAARQGVAGISRVQFAELLVADVTEIRGGLAFVAPGVIRKRPIASSSGAPSGAVRNQQRSFGFAAGAKITVKADAASPEQRSNIDHVLLAGEAKVVPRKLLVCSIMVVTQESSALTSATNGVHRGLFQQDPRYWPATRDPVTDANAFFDRAVKVNAASPSLQYWELCEAVQQSGRGELYAQWRIEAEHTVNAWGVVGGDGADTSSLGAYGSGAVNPADLSFQYTRGTVRLEQASNKYSFIREDDWSCLQRLAQEVQWRCFAVSGVIYFVGDPFLFGSAPRMSISETSDGVDSIDSTYTVRSKKAVLTVRCRIGRWQAPPGTVIEIADMGVHDGRWLVTTIERDLFKPEGTITLQKPQPIIPESQSPEFTSSGTTVLPSPTAGDYAGSGLDTHMRSAIVAAAQRAAANKHDFTFLLEPRPMPKSLFGPPVPKAMDCSTFVTLVYKAAGAPDPNGFGYNGFGDTRSLFANGTLTQRPQPGDLVFYLPYDSPGKPRHVAVFVGGGRIVNMGGNLDPREMAVIDVGLPVLGYMTFALGPDPADVHHHGGG